MIRFIFPFLFTLSFVAAQDKPESYSLERYSVMWENSMFAPRSDEKPKTKPDSTAFWKLAGVFTYEGVRSAVIVDKLSGTVEELTWNQTTKSGLTLLKIVEDKESGATSVKVDQKGKAFWLAKFPRKEVTRTVPKFLARELGLQDYRRIIAAQ